MDETIQKLRDYANLTGDWYINNKLDLLEQQIKNELKNK